MEPAEYGVLGLLTAFIGGFLGLARMYVNRMDKRLVRLEDSITSSSTKIVEKLDQVSEELHQANLLNAKHYAADDKVQMDLYTGQNKILEHQVNQETLLSTVDQKVTSTKTRVGQILTRMRNGQLFTPPQNHS